MALSTEYSFDLPKGLVDADGVLHRRGIMRLATAKDEIEPLRDNRVQGPDDPFLTIIILARVIKELGSISQVTVREIEGLFAMDLAYLQELYSVINFGTGADIDSFFAEYESLASPEAPSPGSEEGEGISTEVDPEASEATGRRRNSAMVEEVVKER